MSDHEDPDEGAPTHRPTDDTDGGDTDGGDTDDEDLEPLREDPDTGSTPTDPAADRTGPYGTDPMGGEAPSG